MGAVAFPEPRAVTITQSLVSGYTALRRGGGIFTRIRQGTEAVIEESLIAGNHVPLSSFSFERNGGGVYAYVRGNQFGETDKPKFTITRSTIYNNDAYNEGGGIFVCGKFDGHFAATNSTISGNRTTDTTNGHGGGIFIARTDHLYETIDAWLRNVTVTNNVSASGGGVEMKDLEGINVSIANSIISLNRNRQSAPNDKSNLVGRVIVADFKHNLVGTGSSILDHTTGNPATIPPANNNLPNNDTPGLDSLKSNGGPTPTHRLLTGSLAIDHGSNDLARDPLTNAQLTTDQRGDGFPRIFDITSVANGPAGYVDIGAYEIGRPKVIDVVIRDLVKPSHDSYRFAEVVGSGEQLRTVPIGNANNIFIQFSEAVTLTGTAITVTSAINGLPYTGTVSTTATTATWTLTSGAVFTYDQVILRIDDAGVTGLAGRLDGNWDNPDFLGDMGTDTFPSGNNVVDADDDFIFRFTVLTGDFNHDNKVDAADYVNWFKYQGTTSGATHAMGDANGDGAVNLTDRDIWISQFGKDFRVWPT
jgi:hypothetical protein